MDSSCIFIGCKRNMGIVDLADQMNKFYTYTQIIMQLVLLAVVGF